MSIVVRCSNCGTLLRFRDDALGKRARCTKCKSIVQILPDDESRPVLETDQAESPDDLADSSRTAASPSARRRVGPKVPLKSAAKTGSIVVQADAITRIVLPARLPIRVAVLLVLLLPIAFASGLGLPGRLLSCVVPLMLTGMFRTSRIRGDRLTTRLHVAFIPVVSHRCDLRGVISVKAKYGYEEFQAETFLLLGPAQLVFGRVFDHLMPSIGGPYQIHIVTAKGRELVAWQGTAEPQFRSTLDLLLRLTKAELKSM